MAPQITDLLADDPPADLLSPSLQSQPLSAPQNIPLPRSPHPDSHNSSPSSSGFLSYPFSRLASSLSRRLTDPDSSLLGHSFDSPGDSNGTNDSDDAASEATRTSTAATSAQGSHHYKSRAPKKPILTSFASEPKTLRNSSVFEAPVKRTASPFAPPPLTALSLNGFPARSLPSAQVLNKVLAEEIRLLLPPRLQLANEWNLAFSVEKDGVSLSTLYSNCANYDGGGGARNVRGGWVLVVKDGSGGVSFWFSPAITITVY